MPSCAGARRNVAMQRAYADLIAVGPMLPAGTGGVQGRHIPGAGRTGYQSTGAHGQPMYMVCVCLTQCITHEG